MAVLLLLDIQVVNELVANLPVEAKTIISNDSHESFSVEFVDISLIDAVMRLVKMLDEPKMIPHLADLVKKEIIIRLLNSSQGISFTPTGKVWFGKSKDSSNRELAKKQFRTTHPYG